MSAAAVAKPARTSIAYENAPHGPSRDPGGNILLPLKLDKARIALEELLGDGDAHASPAEKALQPVRVTVQGGRFASGAWLQLVLPLLADLLQIALIVILVMFMLLERDELRNRVIRLLGYGRLSLTTTALDEAGERVSRYLSGAVTGFSGTSTVSAPGSTSMSTGVVPIMSPSAWTGRGMLLRMLTLFSALTKQAS
jgi:hypothetical protein